MSTLTDAILGMKKAKRRYDEACAEAWSALVASHPEVRDLLDSLDLESEATSQWFCAAHFDQGSKTAVELFDEGRGEEVIKRIRQLAYGVFR